MPRPRLPHQHAADGRLEVRREHPPARGGRLLTWLAAVVGIGAVAMLAFVGSQIVGSAASRNALEDAQRNPPAPGRYAATAAATAAGDDLEVALDGVAVVPERVEVTLTWTNTGAEAIAWECAVFAAPRLTWYAQSVDLDAYASPESTPACDARAEVPRLAPGASRTEVRSFPLDGSWGAGPVRLFFDNGTDGIPTAEFTVDLEAATRT